MCRPRSARFRRASSRKRSASSPRGCRWSTSAIADGRSRRWPFETRFLGAVAPGDDIELSVEIDDVDDDAVSYRGGAEVNGSARDRIERLPGSHAACGRFRCARDVARALCAALRRRRAPDRFHGVAIPRDNCRARSPENRARNHAVPASAPFFADHFPRRPVFPATLLLNAQIGLADALAREANRGQGPGALPVAMTHVKMRAFIVPGQEVDSCAEVTGKRMADAHRTETRDGDGKTIATARVEFVAPDADTMTVRKRVAITGLGLVTPVGNDVATTWDAVLHGKSGGAPISELRRQRLSGAHRGRGEEFRRSCPDRRPQAAEAHQPFASLCACGGRAGAARRRHSPDGRRRDALGLHARRRHDGRRFLRSRRHAGALGRGRRPARRPAAVRWPGERPARVLPQQLRGGLVADHAPARHSWLCVGGAYGLRVRRPGGRDGR